MSGQLNLSFTHLSGAEIGRVPVMVEVVNASLETAVEPQLVHLASGWQHDLAPGTYLARVRFPSGEVVRQTCTVRDGEPTQVKVDVHALSGHESLERQAVLRPLVRDESTPGLAGKAFTSAWARRWRGASGCDWEQIDFDGETVSRDDHTVRYRFNLDHRPNVLQVGGPGIGWRLVSLPALAGVDVTVSPQGEDDLVVEVTTQNAEAEALLGYLRTGSGEAADVTAEALLQHKLGDPIAAAIGGYYLLRTANLGRLAEWAPNLSEWFPWMADGAVIDAWQHIHAGRDQPGNADEHFNAAHQRLLLAAQRGVPVYTEGLKLLVDGLRLLSADTQARYLKGWPKWLRDFLLRFSSTHSGETNAALSFIEPFAVSADWSAATVTYSGMEPANPSPERRYGIPEDRERLVLLQQVRLQDLIELGWLSPGDQLIATEQSGVAKAILSPDGSLNVTDLPHWAWDEWRVQDPGAAPRAADIQRLGRQPALSDLRLASRGEALAVWGEAPTT